MHSKPVYSSAWFDTFAPRPESVASIDVAAISRLCPRPEYPRLLEIACGSGRVAGPLASIGYDVIGLDISSEALRLAQAQAPGPKYVAMDQRDIAQMPWIFDGVIVLWNSIGFGTRANDQETLRGVAQVLRPDGKFLIDLYHPEWLAEQSDTAVRSPGATVRRWIEHGRCFHVITYDNGTVDDIRFNVYLPDDISAALERVGIEVRSRMPWWTAERAPSRACARYQPECRVAGRPHCVSRTATVFPA